MVLRTTHDRRFPLTCVRPKLRDAGKAMFKRLKPLVILGRQITDPLAIKLAQFMNDARALYVAELRVRRGDTWRMIAEDCGRAWNKGWDARQDIGAALCGLASAYLGEDWGTSTSYSTRRPERLG